MVAKKSPKAVAKAAPVAVKRGPGRPPKAETVVARQAVAKLHQAQGIVQPGEPTMPISQIMRIFARYDAAGRGRRFAGWQPPHTGPNDSLQGMDTLRSRARDSRRNDWSSESATQKWSTNLIGTGITPRFKRVKDDDRREEIFDIFSDFSSEIDADGVLDYYAMQTLVAEAWLDSGEVFIRKRSRFTDEGYRIPVQVQVLEADYCPMIDFTVHKLLPLNHVVRSGIEFNKRGRRTAYYFYKRHPTDSSGTWETNELVRVAASEVRHIYKPNRPGALRGVPHLAPVLAHMRNIEDYNDATLERQKLANLFAAFIKEELPDATDEFLNPLTGAEPGELIGVSPGLVQELRPGQSVEWSNPPEAGTTYSDYLRTNHMHTAAALGLPYEIFSGDIKEISDRTLRVIINDFRRFAEQRQWQIIIPMFCQAVVEWFAEAAVLVNELSLQEYDLVRRCEHSPDGWAHIHPVQDPQGKKLEVEAGFRSRASVVGANGDDPIAVDKERQTDDEREQAMKIGPYSKAAEMEAMPKAPAGDQDGIDNEEYNAPPNAKLEAELTQLKQLMNLLVAQNKEMKNTIATINAAKKEEDATNYYGALIEMLKAPSAIQ